MSIFSSKTKMKQLAKVAGVTVYELGDLFYLFVPSEKTNRVIISAHGGHELIGGTNKFTVPDGVSLRFYSDDTYSVLDPGFNKFYTGEARFAEILGEGESCFDYILTKYQGRHGNKEETYQSIANVIGAGISGKANYESFAKKKPQQAKYFEEKAAAYRHAAVLTVRNRWFKGGASLSTAVEAVLAANLGLVRFDCLFCRSTMFGGSQGVEIAA